MHVSRSVVGSQDAGCVGVLAFGSADPIWRPVGVPRVNHCIAHVHPCIVSIKAEGGNQGFTQGPGGGGPGGWKRALAGDPPPQGDGGSREGRPGYGFRRSAENFFGKCPRTAQFCPAPGWMGGGLNQKPAEDLKRCPPVPAQGLSIAHRCG